MADTGWPELARQLDALLDAAPPQRAVMLAAIRARDPALADRLARLLDAHDRPGPLDGGIAGLDDTGMHDRVAHALADRYVIDRSLGSGGMAFVFLAHERKHQRRVVLKVLRPGIAALVGTGRFLDEVRIAAQLAHPHILPLLDSGEAEELLYYVTPFVGGETLRDRLARDGVLPVLEAVTLLRDIADALQHAHGAGIIHRDLKPENVLCVGGHAFLLDFGVAKLEADVTRSTATRPGVAIGTPGYMAPEQAAGEAVDHRADLYVWGILARELLLGRRSADAPIAERRPDVPRTLMALVDACLAFDPVERPASAGVLVAGLDALVATRSERRSRWPLLAGIAMTLAAAALFLWPRHAADATAASGPLAVAPLANETGDTTMAPWGRMAGDWITQGFHASGLLPVVPWQSALLAAEHHAREAAAGRTPDLARTMHDETGANLVVTGAYYRNGDSLSFQAAVANVRTGELVVAPAAVVVHADSAAAGIRQLRERLLGALAVRFDERIAPASGTLRPPLYDAYRRFDRGLRAFNRYEYREARGELIDAWRRDTTFVPALLLAAFAAANEGEWAVAESLSAVVGRQRAELDDYHASVASYLAAYLAGDKPRALRELLRTTAMAPGTRAAYNAAFVLQQLNRPAEAESLLAAMNPDRGPMRDWPAYWSLRAYARHLLGDHAGELEMARTMRARHPDQRVTWVIEARALAAAGHVSSLDSLLAVSAALEPDVYWSHGGMLVVAAEEFRVHGTGSPQDRYRRAADWLHARLAVEPGSWSHRSWLATALIGLGQDDSAAAVLRAMDRERPGRLGVRGTLMLLAARRGDTTSSPWLDGMAAHQRGELLMFRSRAAALAGHDDRAIALLQQALATGVENWHWAIHNAWPDYARLHRDPRFQRLVTRR